MKAKAFAWRKFLADEKLKAAPDELFIREVNSFTCALSGEILYLKY